RCAGRTRRGGRTRGGGSDSRTAARRGAGRRPRWSPRRRRRSPRRRRAGGGREEDQDQAEGIGPPPASEIREEASERLHEAGHFSMADGGGEWGFPNIGAPPRVRTNAETGAAWVR